MTRIYAWAIWFKGNKKEKEGFCFWKATHEEGMFYETKQDARNALNLELKSFHKPKDKRSFTIVKVERVK